MLSLGGVAAQDIRINLPIYFRVYSSVGGSPYCVYLFDYLPCALHLKEEEKVRREARRLGNRVQEEPAQVQRLVLCHQRIQ
ncbi:hypothetical protein Bca4012_040745 [Brassica carinata]